MWPQLARCGDSREQQSGSAAFGLPGTERSEVAKNIDNGSLAAAEPRHVPLHQFKWSFQQTMLAFVELWADQLETDLTYSPRFWQGNHSI